MVWIYDDILKLKTGARLYLAMLDRLAQWIAFSLCEQRSPRFILSVSKNFSLDVDEIY